MTKKDKETHFIPMEVTKETIKDFGIKKEDLKRKKIGNKTVSVVMVPATKEQFEAYMRPIWAELKRLERSRRCMVSDGKGKIKRCEEDCNNCDRMKDGAPLSLDAFFEETELEFEDPDADQSETIMAAMVFEDLLEKLHQQAPDLASIFEMLYDGKSQDAIAKLIGKPQTTVNYMIKRMRMILQQHVSHEDLGI